MKIALALSLVLALASSFDASAQVVPEQAAAWEQRCDPLVPDVEFYRCAQQAGWSGKTGTPCDDVFGDGALANRRQCAVGRFYAGCTAASYGGANAYYQCLEKNGLRATGIRAWRVCAAAPDGSGYRGECYRAFGVKLQPTELCLPLPEGEERNRCMDFSRPLLYAVAAADKALGELVDFLTRTSCGDILKMTRVHDVVDGLVGTTLRAQQPLLAGGFVQRCVVQALEGFACAGPDTLRGWLVSAQGASDALREISQRSETAECRAKGQAPLSCAIHGLVRDRWTSFKKGLGELLSFNWVSTFDWATLCYLPGQLFGGAWLAGTTPAELVRNAKAAYVDLRDRIKLWWRMRKALDELGYDVRDVMALRKVAREMGVDITMREVTPTARGWLRKGLLPKLKFVKMKTGKLADALLMGLRGSEVEGVVLLYDAKRFEARYRTLLSELAELEKAGKKAVIGGVTRKELEEAFVSRGEEWTKYWNASPGTPNGEFAELRQAGVLSVDDKGRVMAKSMFDGSSSPFTGDHDTYLIEGAKSLADKKKVMNRLYEEGLQSVHGDHVDWPNQDPSSFKANEGMYWGIRMKYAANNPWAKKLLRIARDGSVELVYDRDPALLEKMAEELARQAGGSR